MECEDGDGAEDVQGRGKWTGPREVDAACLIRTGGGTRLVRLVWGGRRHRDRVVCHVVGHDKAPFGVVWPGLRVRQKSISATLRESLAIRTDWNITK
jgi:hypothetical protein